eukprot:SAG31_NODE_36943_length_309_cov_0.490476_1_plen_31_part_10
MSLSASCPRQPWTLQTASQKAHFRNLLQEPE